MSDGFTRRLVRRGDRTLIESTCRHCGFVIIGTAMDETLPAAEQKHTQNCERFRRQPSTPD